MRIPTLSESCKQLLGCRLCLLFNWANIEAMLLYVQNMFARGNSELVKVRAAAHCEIRAGAVMLGGMVLETGFGSGSRRLACGFDFATVEGLGKIEGLGLGREEVMTVTGGGLGDYCPGAVCCFLDVYQHFEPLSARFGLAYIIHITPNCMSCQQLFFMFDKTQLYAIFVLWQK